MKKIHIFIVLSLIFCVPTQAYAVKIGNILDPLCLASWRDGCKNNTTEVNYVYTTNTYPTYPTYPPYTPPPVYTQNLSVSCYADDPSIYTGQTVRWIATATGGNGSYIYDWSGSDGLNGSGSIVTKSYFSTGSKYASVIVRSGNQTVTQSCGNLYVNEEYNHYNDYDYNYNYNYNNYYPSYGYNDLSIQCYPNITRTSVGTYVTWRANVYGGTGWYEYSWSGSESIYGTNSTISYAYSRPGSKYATVTVRSGNRSTSQSCGNVYVDDYYNTNYNTPNYQYSGNLDGTCSPTPANNTVSSLVTWTVYPVGGDGYYTYSWSGSDGFTGSQKSVSTSYQYSGTKTASVNIYSAGAVKTIACTPLQIQGNTVTYTKTKSNIEKTPEKTVTVKDKDSKNNSVAALINAFAEVPWFLVMVVVIFVLFGTVMYLLLGKKN